MVALRPLCGVIGCNAVSGLSLGFAIFETHQESQ
jgi:hypothetical protein